MHLSQIIPYLLLFAILYWCRNAASVRIAPPGTRISLMGIGIPAPKSGDNGGNGGNGDSDSDKTSDDELERRREWERRQEEIRRRNELEKRKNQQGSGESAGSARSGETERVTNHGNSVEGQPWRPDQTGSSRDTSRDQDKLRPISTEFIEETGNGGKGGNGDNRDNGENGDSGGNGNTGGSGGNGDNSGNGDNGGNGDNSDNNGNSGKGDNGKLPIRVTSVKLETSGEGESDKEVKSGGTQEVDSAEKVVLITDNKSGTADVGNTGDNKNTYDPNDDDDDDDDDGYVNIEEKRKFCRKNPTHEDCMFCTDCRDPDEEKRKFCGDNPTHKNCMFCTDCREPVDTVKIQHPDGSENVDTTRVDHTGESKTGGKPGTVILNPGGNPDETGEPFDHKPHGTGAGETDKTVVLVDKNGKTDQSEVTVGSSEEEIKVANIETEGSARQGDTTTTTKEPTTTTTLEPTTTTTIAPGPPIPQHLRMPQSAEGINRDRQRWTHRSHKRPSVFDRVWRKMRYGMRSRKIKPGRHLKGTTHLERAWDKMRGVRRPPPVGFRQKDQSGVPNSPPLWREPKRRSVSKLSAKKLISTFHGEPPFLPVGHHPGAQHRKRTLLDGQSRVFLTDQNRYYWYGTRDYFKDNYRYSVSDQLKPAHHVLTCQADIRDQVAEQSLPTYDDGAQMTHVVFNCDKRWERCCGLDCCPVWSASSAGRTVTALLAHLVWLFLCLCFLT